MDKITTVMHGATWGLALLVAVSVLFTSCSKEQEDFFDESASARMANTISKAKSILRNSEYGWEFEYYPDRDLSYGGLVYIVKFDSLDATVTCTLVPDSTVTSYYKITNDNGPVLTFDTYNPLMHYFATPSSSEYEAKDGDFEFVIDQMTDDEIVLYGKRTRNTMYLRKLKYSPEEYAAKTIANMDNFILSVHGRMGTAELNGTFNLNNKSLEIINGSDTTTCYFAFNDMGIRLYEPLELGGMKAHSFAFNAEANTLTCLDAGSESIVLQGVPHGDGFLSYSQCAGDYKLSYNKGKMDVMVSLVPHRIDGTYLLRGLSSEYELVLNYDFNTGELFLAPQMIGILDNKAVYFLTMDMATEDIWIGGECALKLVWNNDDAFTFTAANPDKYPCDSGILMKLYYSEDGQLTGDDVTETDWLTNQKSYFLYFTSLTKNK